MRIQTPIVSAALGLALAASLPAAVTGCATSSAERLDSTTSTMADIQSDLDRGEAQLETLLVSMQNLESSEDIDATYRSFRRAAEDIEDTADRVRSRRVSLEARAADHAARWQAESARLSGDRAQEISEDRREQFKDSVNSVSDELDELRAAYDPFVTKLNDLRVVLSNDLTRRGIERTAPLRADLREMAADLKKRSEAAREALSDARDDFAR
tara:strand:- start:19 stop:657 length:639 start_codon:yes stop_codon:yes gene_type:complete